MSPIFEIQTKYVHIRTTCFTVDGLEGVAGGVGVGEDGLDAEAVVVGGGAGAEREGGVHLDVGCALGVVESAEGVDEGVAGVAERAGVALDGVVVAEADGGEEAELVVVHGVVWRLDWRLDWRWRLGDDNTRLGGGGAGEQYKFKYISWYLYVYASICMYMTVYACISNSSLLG